MKDERSIDISSRFLIEIDDWRLNFNVYVYDCT